MPARQTDALQRNPNQLDLVSVATYERLVAASLERVWENVLDWEHLPHLHDASFNYCELQEAGAWGWRCYADAERQSHIELCVGEGEYVARTYFAEQQVSEIWTRLVDVGGATQVLVEFLVPGVAGPDVAATGEFYKTLYTRLWDEDESMMQQRQRRLDEQRDAATQIDLGAAEELRGIQPLRFQWRRQEYELSLHEGQWRASPTVCPHLLGPLQSDPDNVDTLRCPWHGYQFDRASGDCISPASARCRLPRTPLLTLQKGRLIATLAG